MGIYCLRFEQRGGTATGVDFHHLGEVIEKGSTYPNTGENHDNEILNSIRQMYNCQYVLKVGGFTEQGQIVPKMEKFDLVSSFNVIEYISEQEECIKSLFSQSKQRVMIATDVCYGPSYDPNSPPIKFITGIEELKIWMQWPYEYWTLNIGSDALFSQHQAFFVATHPDSTLPPVDTE